MGCQLDDNDFTLNLSPIPSLCITPIENGSASGCWPILLFSSWLGRISPHSLLVPLGVYEYWLLVGHIKVTRSTAPKSSPPIVTARWVTWGALCTTSSQQMWDGISIFHTKAGRRTVSIRIGLKWVCYLDYLHHPLQLRVKRHEEHSEKCRVSECGMIFQSLVSNMPSNCFNSQ